jgi:hypothetical protein
MIEQWRLAYGNSITVKQRCSAYAYSCHQTHDKNFRVFRDDFRATVSLHSTFMFIHRQLTSFLERSRFHTVVVAQPEHLRAQENFPGILHHLHSLWLTSYSRAEAAAYYYRCHIYGHLVLFSILSPSYKEIDHLFASRRS